jgi:hypothetical protein
MAGEFIVELRRVGSKKAVFINPADVFRVEPGTPQDTTSNVVLPDKTERVEGKSTEIVAILKKLGAYWLK